MLNQIHKRMEGVVIFSGTIWEAEMIKTLLENEEIQVFKQDEIMGSAVPWIAKAGALGAVKLLVAESDEVNAMRIVEEYKRNRDTDL